MKGLKSGHGNSHPGEQRPHDHSVTGHALKIWCGSDGLNNPEVSNTREQYILLAGICCKHSMDHETLRLVKNGSSGQMVLRRLMRRITVSLMSMSKAREQQDPFLFCSAVLAGFLSFNAFCCLSCRFSIQHHPCGLPLSPQVLPWLVNLYESSFPHKSSPSTWLRALRPFV